MAGRVWTGRQKWTVSDEMGDAAQNGTLLIPTDSELLVKNRYNVYIYVG
jgi:hypothetical protein